MSAKYFQRPLGDRLYDLADCPDCHDLGTFEGDSGTCWVVCTCQAGRLYAHQTWTAPKRRLEPASGVRKRAKRHE